MKVKEVNLTASIAWSPKSSGTPYLACGTAAPHADSVAKSDALQVAVFFYGQFDLYTVYLNVKKSL